MLRDWQEETKKRVAFIENMLKESGAAGVVFGNSGGKDSALVGILCRMATPNVLGIIMPCATKSNYEMDLKHAQLVAQKYKIDTKTVDLTELKELFSKILGNEFYDKITGNALSNINPRLRMITLYAVAQSLGYIVAGTGNRSEITMGYFTKWGDGACDFNPIADLTVTEVYEYLTFLGAPKEIIQKPPSAGLWEGQTDEQELGMTYKQIDDYLLYGKADVKVKNKIENLKRKTEHKRQMPRFYTG